MKTFVILGMHRSATSLVAKSMSGIIGSTDGIPRGWAVETMSGAAWKYQVINKYPVRCVTDAK